VHRRRPVIAIIGAGAVGGYYGARLAQHGHDVHFLLRRDFDAVRENGWTVRSHAGDFHMPPDRIDVHRDVQAMPRADLVIVALKTTANDQLQSLIAPLRTNDTLILTLQNGLGNEERLAELFGPDHILGGMAFVCINRTGPGALHHIAEGSIRLGEFHGGPRPRTQEIAGWFQSSGVPCDVLNDLRWGRWAKLVWNVPFNGLGAVLDWTTDRLIATEAGVQLVSAVMREIIAAAEALGLKMPPDMVERQLAHTRAMGAYQTSMQIDRREGRPLEVEAILCEPLRQARRANVATPHLHMLYELALLVDPATAG